MFWPPAPWCATTVEAIQRAGARTWVKASGDVDAVVTTGGTGLTGRDVTPEALEPLFDKRIDGFSVVFHMVSYQSKIGLSTLQSPRFGGAWWAASSSSVCPAPTAP